MKRSSAFVALATSICALSAQTWDDTGNTTVIPGTNFLGSLNNAQLDVITNDIRRMTLLPDATYTVGGFASQVKDGSLLLSPDVDQFYSIGGSGPFSLLHLAAATNNAQDNGYRPWMRNGINFTGNNDQMYIGHKYTTSDLTDPGASILSDYSDAVIQWSDNPGTWLGDRMRFIFTSEYSSSTTTGNSSLEGLEAMQLFPVENGSEVHVGIGDWYGASAQPEERLDVLDRTIRVRELPTDYEDVNKVIEKVVVTDDNGRLHWRPIEDFAGQTDCDWYIDNANEVVATAWNGVLSCNDEDWKVKIGQDPGASSAAKLTVATELSGSGQAINAIAEMNGGLTGTSVFAEIDVATGGTPSTDGVAVQGTARNAATSSIGVAGVGKVDQGSTTTNVIGIDGLGTAQGSANHSYGVRGMTAGTGVSGANTNEYGGFFSAEGNSSANRKYGVFGRARYGSPTTSYGVYGNAAVGNTRYGVFGTAAVQNNSWAGYFNGNARVTGALQVNTTWYSSDGAFKDNVEDIQNALDLVEQIQPRTYDFSSNAPSSMHLPQGLQYGVVAQELEQVIPALVSDVVHPAQYDTTGIMIEPASTYKAVNYVGLIPVLLAAVKEQQGVIADQAHRLDQLEQDLASCCTHPDGTIDGRSMQQEGTGSEGNVQQGISKSDDRLSIVPNPFQERTTLSYLLDAPAMVQLQVSTEQGLHLATLRNQQHDAGAYSMTWDTQDLAPGIYYVSLFADGRPVVKKAVKVK